MTSSQTPDSLHQALDFKISELLKYDFWIGLTFGIASSWLGATDYGRFRAAIPIAVGLVGVVIGAVIAGVAILGAFLDLAFLRKLKQINREPVRYMAPFLFTAVLGIFTSLVLMVIAVFPESKPIPKLLQGTLGFVAGLGTAWTLVSVLPALRMLVQFVGLQMDAAEVPEIGDVQSLRRPRRTEEEFGGGK